MVDYPVIKRGPLGNHSTPSGEILKLRTLGDTLLGPIIWPNCISFVIFATMTSGNVNGELWFTTDWETGGGCVLSRVALGNCKKHACTALFE